MYNVQEAYKNYTKLNCWHDYALYIQFEKAKPATGSNHRPVCHIRTENDSYWALYIVVVACLIYQPVKAGQRIKHSMSQIVLNDQFSGHTTFEEPYKIIASYGSVIILGCPRLGCIYLLYTVIILWCVISLIMVIVVALE